MNECFAYTTDFGVVRISPDDYEFFKTIEQWVGPREKMPAHLLKAYKSKIADIEKVAKWQADYA